MDHSRASSSRLSSLCSLGDSAPEQQSPGHHCQPSDCSETTGLVQRCIVIQKDQDGFGFTVSGDRIVVVQSVQPGGAAMKAGVQEGDRIVKTRGLQWRRREGPTPPSPLPRRYQKHATLVLQNMLRQEEAELQMLYELYIQNPVTPIEDQIRGARRRLSQLHQKFRRDTGRLLEAGSENVVVPPGTYGKVAGHLRSFQNKKSLVAFKIKDMNEFTTHMLEINNAHMILRKGSTAMSKMPSSLAPPVMGGMSSYGGSSDLRVGGLSPQQRQVLNLIKSCARAEGIHLLDLKPQLPSINMPTLKKLVEFLSSEGHIYSTIDEQHFKSTDAE